MSDEFILREDASPEIFEQVMALWSELGLYRAHRGDNYEILQRTLQHGGKLFTLWHDELLIGTAWIMNDGRRLHVHYMGIRQEYQGRKLSHRLLEGVMAYAKTVRLPLKLEVHADNPAARHLYRHWGFDDLDDYVVMINRQPW